MKEPGSKVKDLTILLTLKGRHLHTLRWLWHANRICLPFHVIVADGEVHPTIDRLLSSPKTFPNLSFEYHRYEDKSYRDFYYKCADALGKVKTPYVMISDNDDFLFPFGIQRSAAFLNSAPEYVCAGGGIPGFSIKGSSDVTRDVVGPFRRIKYRYISNGWYKCRDLNNPSVEERVLEEIRNPLAVYYFIYRTQALRAIADEILAFNLNFRLHESYLALRTVTLGKVKSSPSYFIYFRQQGTSMNAGSETDWVNAVIRSRFAQDLEVIVSKIASDAARSDGSDQAEIKERIYEAFATSLRITLACTLMRYRFPRLFVMKKRFLSLPKFSLMPALLRRKLDQKKIWKLLVDDGSDKNTISVHKKELDDIFYTLQDDEFISFVSQNAKDLLA